MMTALRAQPKPIIYPDYKPTQDFPLWLTGLMAKIRAAHGFKLTEADKVQAEVIRSIAGKLSVGSALDTYNRLTEEEKADYDRMVARLTEEFTDPSDKLEFRKKIDFNKRKKGQKLKDYMQEIKRDMTRYSGVPDKIHGASGGTTDNPEKERQGVRRFKAGLRTKKGNKSPSLNQHMDYHLQEDSELTWTNAIKVATRWEMAHGDDDEEEEIASGEEVEDEEESCSQALKAMETKVKKVKNKSQSKSNVEIISALADRVHENQMKIKGIETEQGKVATALEKVVESQNTISAKLDASLNKPQQQQYYMPPPAFQQYQPQPQPYFIQQPYGYQPFPQPIAYQQPVYAAQPYQQVRAPQVFQQQRFRSPIVAAASTGLRPRGNVGYSGRPRHVTFHARTGQPSQGNYGLLRRTPTTFPAATAAPAMATTAAAAPVAPAAAVAAVAATPTAVVAGAPMVAPAMDATAVAAVEEAEVSAESLLGAEGGGEEHYMYTQYVAMADPNGYIVPEGELVAAVDQWNFV